jgi:hypothetical protein
MRVERSRPLWLALHLWLQLARQRVPEGSAIHAVEAPHWGAAAAPVVAR